MHYAKIAEHACCMERGKLSCVGDDECAPDDVDAGWRIRYLLHAALYRARASARAVSAAVTGGHGAAFWAVLLAGVALGAALASAVLELARRRRYRAEIA